jgi:DNA-binding FadR family transcriptional regulator
MALPERSGPDRPGSGRPSVGRKTEKLSEAVAREILRDIQEQGLAPGTKLPPESVMLERFDIGRASMREALRILEINGLVTIKTGPGGGPIVAAPDPRAYGQMATLHMQAIGATFRELLAARVDLESMLAGRAAAQEGTDAAELVRDAMEQSRHPQSDDWQYARVSSGFHSTVFKAAGNPVLSLIANSIQSIWAVRVTSVLFAPDERHIVSKEHEGITKAIEQHDARKAERLMRAHMQRYQQYCEIRYPARMDDVVDWV